MLPCGQRFWSVRQKVHVGFPSWSSPSSRGSGSRSKPNMSLISATVMPGLTCPTRRSNVALLTSFGGERKYVARTAKPTHSRATPSRAVRSPNRKNRRFRLIGETPFRSPNGLACPTPTDHPSSRPGTLKRYCYFPDFHRQRRICHGWQISAGVQCWAAATPPRLCARQVNAVFGSPNGPMHQMLC